MLQRQFGSINVEIRLAEDFGERQGNRASYTPDLFAELGEPLPDVVNGYRAAALAWLKIMFAVDEFILAAEDARLAVVAVAVVLGWPSTRGLTVPEIAEQLGVSTSTITRACARFREMAGLDSAGGVRPSGQIRSF